MAADEMVAKKKQMERREEEKEIRNLEAEREKNCVWKMGCDGDECQKCGGGG